MATVFSNVEADIADDLLCRFPQEFDFDAMLRKVCEDAGVVVVNNADNGEDGFAKYRVKGLWLAMEKAYKHLVTTLALYGTRLSDSTVGDNKQLNMGPVEDDTIEYKAGTIADLETLDDGDRTGVKNFLQDIFGNTEKRRIRRPRKSARQSRNIDHGEALEAEKSINLAEETKQETFSSRESVSDSIKDGEQTERASQMEENDTADKEKIMNGDETEDGQEKPVNPRKRGRPRKSEPFHLHVKKVVSERVTKKRGTNKKHRVIVPISNAELGEMQPIRRRGRPKIYDDEGKTEFPCTDCSFVAKKSAKLRSHQLRMHLSSPTKCDLCTKVFPNKRYMLRHRASHVEPQHCCDVCGKMYKIRKAMLDHRRTHDTAYQKPKFKCEHCPKAFCNRYILECHVRDIHMGQKKSYLCSICGKSFTTRHSLKEHSDAHTGVKPHVCEVCGKSFSYESALRDHRFTHTDSKHFWCQHCQKGFSQRSGLKMHMRIHRQNKMFICSECGRGFTQKQALQRHERVHKGEKPFVCKHCGRFFTDASIIRRHLILVHKIHKDAGSWRDDIVCTVKATNEYHVQKVGEEDRVSELEKAKEEIIKVVGAQPRPATNKGPSRAFARTYPRRVAILDEQGNVIAPPESPIRNPVQRFKSNSTESNSSILRNKSMVVPASSNSSIVHNEASSDLDQASQVLSQRYLDSSQWDALTSQIRVGNAAHIEHIILDDTAQHEIQRGIEQVQGLQKIIKYESMQGLAGLASSASTNILSQTHSQSSPSPSTSPISFVSQPSTNPRTLETQFEAIAPQAAHTGSQYYDARSGGHSSTAPWPSMFYYSQLASQFGMTINPDYTYVSSSSNVNTPASHLGQYVTHSGSDSHPGTTATLILQPQPLSQLESSITDRSGLQDDTSHHGSGADLSLATTNPGHSSTDSVAPLSLHPTAAHSQDIIQIRHIPTDLKLGSPTNPTQSLHQTDIILQQDDLPSIVEHHEHSPTHALAAADVQHHIADMERVVVDFEGHQRILVRTLELPASTAETPPSNKQSLSSIPTHNTAASTNSLKQE